MKYRFQCAECGYAYKSLWYEPNWIAKLFYIPDHKSFHYTSWLNDYPSQWKRHGAEMERERILAMKKDIINCVIDYGLTPEKYERICEDIDALIKGEK